MCAEAKALAQARSGQKEDFGSKFNDTDSDSMDPVKEVADVGDIRGRRVRCMDLNEGGFRRGFLLRLDPVFNLKLRSGVR